MSARIMLFSAAFVLLAAGTAAAGPPWISVEMPANPHDAASRGAPLMIRAYHHSSPLSVQVTGIAEGIVDGRRVTQPLELVATRQTGVYALKSALPKGGTWVLAFTLAESRDVTATALVTVDAAGRIVHVDVPSSRSRDGWSVPRRVEKRDIEAALRAAHVAMQPGGDASGTSYAYALPLVLIGVAAVLTRKRIGRG